MDHKDLILHDQGEPQGEWHVDQKLLAEAAKELGLKGDEPFLNDEEYIKKVELTINDKAFPDYILAMDNMHDFSESNPGFLEKMKKMQDPNQLVDSSIFSDPRYYKYMPLETKRIESRFKLIHNKPSYQILNFLDISEAYTKKAKIIFM